ncbi:Gfo/Idh/MocA family protein [Actinosynnema sp. ALI-1.44]|uniref:Gfo/Idh/MocA family protein n=1 Tax=Actinosynnema sp. ALI-1.44 TaxID=1933779 RepID=UPI00192D0A5D|nr:Gfo/Idh/MocA family oxidoreductase [Actinosynnema sp. ALI-1.44]
MSEIRLGIVGLGVMGRRTLGVAVDHPDFTVVRASDVTPADPGVPFTTDPQEVVTADDVDAVYIATPPASHSDLAVTALRAGKAVFCEKPLAVSLADAQRMLDAATETGLANAVNFALSDRDAVVHVAGADLGTVRGVDIRVQFLRWPRDFQATATWLARREQGGFVREVLSHFVYLTDRIVGPLAAVETSVDYSDGPDGTGSEVAARGLLRAGDVPVHVSGMSDLAGPERYEWTIWGTRRSYMLRDWAQLYVSEGGPWQPVELSGKHGTEHSRLTLFAEAIRGGKPADLADFAAGYRVQHAIEAFHGLQS